MNEQRDEAHSSREMLGICWEVNLAARSALYFIRLASESVATPNKRGTPLGLVVVMVT
jgi:hypothetical protein